MASDPLTGTWTTGREFMYLRYDGHRTVSGTLTSGGRQNLAQITTGSFDGATGALRLEGEARHPGTGAQAQFLVEGTLGGNHLRVTYHFGDATGEATLSRLTVARMFRSGLAAMLHFAERGVQAVLVPMIRAAHPRRNKAQNQQLMRERGESPATFIIREARESDIDALAQLHVVTWAATYPEVLRPPTFAIRSWQWRDAFAKQDGSWFCYVVENGKGELVGFTKGVHSNDGSGSGNLNKIYLLSEYQRLGLGRRMLAAVTDRFLGLGITRMTVHAEESNPSCRFYEATGAVNTIDERTGRTNGGSYAWKNLAELKVRLENER